MNPFAGLPRNHYQIVLADPPWKFKVYNEATGSSRVQPLRRDGYGGHLPSAGQGFRRP